MFFEFFDFSFPSQYPEKYSDDSGHSVTTFVLIFGHFFGLQTLRKYSDATVDRRCCVRQIRNGGGKGGRAGRNSARAFCRRNQEGRYSLISGPINGLGRPPSPNKIFGAGLGCYLPRKSAKKDRMYYVQ